MKPSVFRVYCALLFTVLFTSSLFAQKQVNYNLLWRISGKGMQRPSYLFGTMHVRDARAFHFSDSVMTAILKCDAFALEVHPDTLVQQMFTELSKRDSSRNLRKLLSPEAYERLAKRFKEQNGYDMDDVDPMLVESSLTREDKHPSDKATFVDAYLFAIARTNAKKICGLEKAADQFNSLYGSSDDMKIRLLDLLEIGNGELQEGTNRMVELYQSGNIDAVWAYILENNMNSGDLNARNKVMANSISKQMAAQPLFSAVGVAHLPGAEGVISLLRKAGYSVEAVPATFTGVADKYQVDYMKMPWFTHTDADKGFSVDMPGTPVRTKIIGGLNTSIYADLGNEVYYGVFAFPKGSDAHPVKTEQVINQAIANFKAGAQNQLISRKSDVVNGVPCTDVVIKNGTGYLRFNFIVKYNMLYCLYIGNDQKSLNQPFANRFFKSFKCFAVAPKAPATWINYNNAVAAFKAQLPAQPSPVEKEAPNTLVKGGAPIQLHLLIATDTVTAVNYYIRYNDYPVGSYLADKYAVFNSLAGEFKGKGKIIGNIKTVWKDQIEGREVKVMLLDKYFTTIQFYPRGNRVYMLMRQNLSEGLEEEPVDAFFDNFTFTPYQASAGYAFEPEGEHFKLLLPAKPIIKPDTLASTSHLTKSVQCYISNPNSGGAYSFEYSQLGPYYRAVSLDSLYMQTLTNLHTWADTIIKKDTITIAGKKAIQYITLRKATTDKTRHAVLVDNGHFYYWSAHATNEELDSPISNAFFSSLQLSEGDTPVDIYASKAEKIKTDLLSADTTVSNAAKGALTYYTFDKTELPVVYQMLNHSYADDSLAYNGTRSRLVRMMKKVHDKNSGDNLLKLYAEVDGKDEIRAAILSALPEVDPIKGYGHYLDLITTGKALNPHSKYQMFAPLSDSLTVFAANFKRLLPLVNEISYRSDILRLVNNLCEGDSSAVYLPMVKNAFGALTAHAPDDLKHYLNDKDTTNDGPVYPVYYYLSLMQKIKGQGLASGFTASIIKKGDDTGLLSDAAITRIYNHLPVDLVTQAKLLRGLDSRYEMLNAYYNEKLLRLVPAQYTRADEFGRLCLYKYIYDDEDETAPEKLQLLGSIADKGKTYYAYKFSLPVAEDEKLKSYIGISGPYTSGSSALSFKRLHSYTGYDVLKTNWQVQARKLLPKLQELNKN